MLVSAVLLMTAAQSLAQLPPVSSADVVKDAISCVEAVKPNGVELARLTNVGWVERLDAKGKPETPGGHTFRRPDSSGQIVVVGGVCSLTAPVGSFDDVKATVLQLDDAFHPDKIEETDRGIFLRNGRRSVMFFIGNPTNQKPAAVRIDAQFSETK